ncbi:OLC1v1019534C1 [Oldenlandia corymbosa var. corymbosa]|uniref:OLC1v1019534C1 n=1 Tax=Oldenlandia corymbosa var. corymbosa TaxID=529605 RepID=A0AAV1EE76_OLDCO|nr:OLC1v1019534C1 [Oldenlandia corymbosa var. corymbosa]
MEYLPAHIYESNCSECPYVGLHKLRIRTWIFEIDFTLSWVNSFISVSACNTPEFSMDANLKMVDDEMKQHVRNRRVDQRQSNLLTRDEGPMYPRVKVRGQEEYDDQFEYGKRSLQSLKVPEFLSSSDFSSPDDSPTSVVRVPQLDSSYPGAMNDRKPKILEENGASFKANPVFRPRAVLSSPDNDQIFGSKNKTRGESSPCSKKNGSIPSRHTKCKVVRGPVTADGPLNTRTDVKEVVARRNIFQSKQRTATPDPSLKVSKGNPKPIQDGALRKSPMTKR